MKPSTILLLALLQSRHTHAQALTPKTPSTLDITAISAQDGVSTLECWTLDAKFDLSDEPGTAGSAELALEPFAAGNATYSVIPPRFDGGVHNAPSAQWVIFLSGLAHITLPNCTEEVFVLGGKGGMIVAVDTADVSEEGHSTKYPGDEQTVAVQVPFPDGVFPPHRVLYGGPCRANKVRR